MMFLVAIFFCTSDSGLDNDDEQTRNFVMLERKGKKSSDVGNRTFSDSRLTTGIPHRFVLVFVLEILVVF